MHSTVEFSTPNPAGGHCWPTPPSETPRHSQTSLDQSLVEALFLSPGFWCTQGFVCALQGSVSPVLWKFRNQIPLASKVKFPGGSQSLCRITRLGNLWLYGGANDNLLQGGLCYTLWPRSAAARAPVPMAGHCWPVPPQETLEHSKAGLAQALWGLWVLVLTGFVWALQASLQGMGFDFKHDFTPPTVLLRLLLCYWMCGIFFWWDPTFSRQWLFSRELQFWRSRRRRWVYDLLLHWIP